MRTSIIFARAGYLSMLFWAGLVVGRVVPPLTTLWAAIFGGAVGLVSIGFACFVWDKLEVRCE